MIWGRKGEQYWRAQCKTDFSLLKPVCWKVSSTVWHKTVWGSIEHLENCHQAGSRYNPTNNVLNSYPQKSLPFLGLWELLASNMFKCKQIGLGHLLLHTWVVDESCTFISLLLPFFVLLYGLGLLQHLSFHLAASSVSRQRFSVGQVRTKWGSKWLRCSNSKWNAFWLMFPLLTNSSWTALQHFHF